MSDFATRQKQFNLTSAAQTRAVLAQPDTQVLDVRRPDEIAATGSIDHANLHQVAVSLEDASALIACAPQILPSKTAPIFIYCRSGRRATNAVQAL